MGLAHVSLVDLLTRKNFATVDDSDTGGWKVDWRRSFSKKAGVESRESAREGRRESTRYHGTMLSIMEISDDTTPLDVEER